MSLVGISTVIAPWLGEWATVTVAGAVLNGIQHQFNPTEIQKILKLAEGAAEAAQPATGGLFCRCDRDGPNKVQNFLEQFFQSTEVLNELQKPLQNAGKPDLNVLVAAFEKLATNHKAAKNYMSDSLPLWMDVFVGIYFEEIKGICFKVAKAQYLEQLAQRVKKVQFVGMAVSDSDIEQPETLAQIFVMPDVREERNRNLSQVSVTINGQSGYHMNLSGKETPKIRELNRLIKQNDLLKEQKEWAMRDRSSPRIPAPKILNLSQKKAVVLGAPGSGKTMLVSYFALMLCETPQSDPTQIGLEPDADYLPVVVRIRDWILQPQMGLLEYLGYYAKTNLCTKELPTGFFEHWLEWGRALILLDGLDEVVDEAQRRKVAEQIETFLHRYQSNPAVITSRPAGYRRDSFNNEFPHYTLESFDDKQVTIFINHWYDSRLKDDAAQAARRKADLQSAFARNERIRLLAKNPLLLTIITLIHRYQAELPRQRCKLYEKAVETLLTSWDSGKEIKLYDQVLLFLKPDDLLYILKKLAYWIHTQGSTGETEGGTLIDKDELLRQLQREIRTLKKCEPHEAKGEAERFIDFIQRRTGLLNEQGRDRYAFVHKTFQEYLTAEEIFDRADVEDDTEIILDHFREHLHDQHWREVLLLLVSKLKGKKAQKAIQAVLDAGSEYEQWLQRDLLFAGWCLTEDPPELMMVAGELVGDILDRLVGLEVETSDKVGEKIRGEVAKILHCFGETTIEQDAWVKLQAQGDLIGQFRLILFQATLGQEKQAISQLLSLLGDQESKVRYVAAQVLGKLGNSSSKVVSALLSLLHDRDVLLRNFAASALGDLGVADPALVKALLSLLGSPTLTPASLLVYLGNSNPELEIVSDLLPLLQDPELGLRCNTAWVLGRLHNSNPEIVNGLILLLRDPELHVRYSAVLALSKKRNIDREIVNSLLSLLQDPDMRSCIATALGDLGNIEPEVVSSLISLLQDSELHVRYSAAAALVQLENVNPEVMSVLSLLSYDKSIMNPSYTAALVRIGKVNSEVVSGLLSLLRDQDWQVRSSASSVLSEIGNTSSDVVGGLLSLLDDKESIVRSKAFAALGQLAKTSDAICPKVLQWLEQNPNHDGIGSAIDCLWSIVVE